MPRTLNTTKIFRFDDETDTYVKAYADTGENRVESAPSIPAAKVGTLTTRTDNDTGTFTMDSGHGFSTGNKIDVFWPTGSRRNMTATVTVNSVVLDGGSGDVLPAAATAITAMKPVEVTVPTIDGDTVVGLVVYSPVAGYVVLCVDTSTLTAPYQLDRDVADGFSTAAGDDNPLAGVNITIVKFSHGDSSSAQDMYAAAIVDV